MPDQEKLNGTSTERQGINSRNSEDNIYSINNIHSIEDGEERGVYFADGLRKIDLVLAYEGKDMKLANKYII